MGSTFDVVACRPKVGLYLARETLVVDLPAETVLKQRCQGPFHLDVEMLQPFLHPLRHRYGSV